ncbi:MAG: GMC oxidoreductase [Pseudonocardiaceae bacterium]
MRGESPGAPPLSNPSPGAIPERRPAAHQYGTIRFGTDPTSSALDLDCRMHEVDLYVADSSFFVSSSAVNPTLTIIANALRVADHLVGHIGTRAAVSVAAG